MISLLGTITKEITVNSAPVAILDSNKIYLLIPRGDWGDVKDKECITPTGEISTPRAEIANWVTDGAEVVYQNNENRMHTLVEWNRKKRSNAMYSALMEVSAITFAMSKEED